MTLLTKNSDLHRHICRTRWVGEPSGVSSSVTSLTLGDSQKSFCLCHLKIDYKIIGTEVLFSAIEMLKVFKLIKKLACSRKFVISVSLHDMPYKLWVRNIVYMICISISFRNVTLHTTYYFSWQKSRSRSPL